MAKISDVTSHRQKNGMRLNHFNGGRDKNGSLKAPTVFSLNTKEHIYMVTPTKHGPNQEGLGKKPI